MAAFPEDKPPRARRGVQTQFARPSRGGGFPGADGATAILAAPDTNRERNRSPRRGRGRRQGHLRVAPARRPISRTCAPRDAPSGFLANHDPV